jgi:hypothetical protein
MSVACSKCGGSMQEGVTTAFGLHGSSMTSSEGSQLVFIVPGAPVSLNPIKAFAQGLADEPSDQIFRISGLRCSECGLLELYAT